MRTEPVPVRLGDRATSGLARIVQQYLEQDQAELESKRKRAARLLGRVAMIACDQEVRITLDFRGDEIVIFDGESAPIDASIAGPYRSLLRLIQGRANPLVEHLRGRLRVRSRPRRLLLPLRLHRLMKLAGEEDHARRSL
ncbi:MAG: SCP2 sterol-binding domain-containing protein [Myxococcota bacterium]